MRTFKATVNTGIYLFKKSTIDKLKDNFIIAADFHNLDIKKGDLEAGFDMLMEENSFDETKDGYTIISDREMAIYAYRQKIIKKFSNLSFFIASPKLFKLMNDTTNVDIFKKPPLIKVDFNDKEIELVKLGDIAEVKQGLATADNDFYLRQLPGTRGNYKEIDLSLVLKEEELEKIRKDENLRIDVIENGICTNPDDKKHKPRYFGNRYFVPYDKGGASDVEEGWLPNYYVPTPYFIDWSEKAIRRMKTLTIADIHRKQGKSIPLGREYYKTQIAALLRNKEFYFRNGITSSRVGEYSPSFRFSPNTVFDSACSNFYLNNNFKAELKIGLALLNSKIFKFFFKAFVNHTVNSQVDDSKDVPIIYKFPAQKNIIPIIDKITQYQKQDPKYDYMINEQVEIDKLVYEMYNLNEDDIKEVENWYFRRYPKLAKIVEEKLKRKNNGK